MRVTVPESQWLMMRLETPSSSDVRQQFEQQGFAIFPNVLNSEELKGLQQACDEMVDMAVLNPKDIFCNLHGASCRSGRAVRRLSASSRLQEDRGNRESASGDPVCLR